MVVEEKGEVVASVLDPVPVPVLAPGVNVEGDVDKLKRNNSRQ